MRNIKFKGQRKDSKEWVYGDYYKTWIYDLDTRKQGFRHYIGWIVKDKEGKIWNEYEEVIPETVGQYTGLNDIDGVDIYECDIVETTYNKYICKWNEYRCEFAWYSLDNTYIYPIGDVRKNIKVIGNIYENPELLEVVDVK